MTTKPEKRDGVDTGRPIARVVAGVLTLDLVSSWHYLAIFWTSDSPRLLSVVSAFLALLVVSIIGLITGRRWAFYTTYSFLITSTLLLGDSAIPWVVRLLPPGDVAPTATAAANGLLMGATAFSHSRHRRALGRETGGPPPPGIAARPPQ